MQPLSSDNVPSPYTPVTEELLQYITQRIVTKCHPEKIILFGSYAYGTPQPHSDVDLLVVMHSHKSAFARHKQISGLFPQRLFALDILVKTPAEMAYRLKIQDPFFQKIVTQGRVLYERRNRRRVDSQSRRRLRKRATARAPAQKILADNLCWASQPCAEKYLKAFLTRHRIDFERRHDLVMLNTLCMRVDSDFRLLANAIADLEPCSPAVRYPGTSVSEGEARAAFAAMKIVRRFVRAKLGLKG